jgi:hypothetical protein
MIAVWHDIFCVAGGGFIMDNGASKCAAQRNQYMGALYIILTSKSLDEIWVQMQKIYEFNHHTVKCLECAEMKTEITEAVQSKIKNRK